MKTKILSIAIISTLLSSSSLFSNSTEDPSSPSADGNVENIDSLVSGQIDANIESQVDLNTQNIVFDIANEAIQRALETTIR